MEKPSSMKLVPGNRKVRDCWPNWPETKLPLTWAFQTQYVHFWNGRAMGRHSWSDLRTPYFVCRSHLHCCVNTYSQAKKGSRRRVTQLTVPLAAENYLCISSFFSVSMVTLTMRKNVFSVYSWTSSIDLAPLSCWILICFFYEMGEASVWGIFLTDLKVRVPWRGKGKLQFTRQFIHSYFFLRTNLWKWMKFI